MDTLKNYKGRCFCDDIQFTLRGDPEAMAYCHCDSCRHWSAGLKTRVKIIINW